MPDIVEPSPIEPIPFEPAHLAAFLSPYERGDDGAAASHLADAASRIELLPMTSGEPIVVPAEMQPDFELARRRLLDETV